MEKIKNIHDASSFWFFVLAFLYMAMVLALRNGYLVDFLLSFMRILDLPFAFIALLYGGTTLVLQLNFDKAEDIENSGWTLVIFIICLLLLGFVAVMNFGFPAVL